MSAYPFQDFDCFVTKDIGSTPTLIFGKQNTCILESMIFANQVDNSILFSFYLLREEGSPTPTEAIEYPFVLDLRMESKQSLDWLTGKNPLIVRGGDTLWAYSDYNINLFNTFISHRELKQVTPA